MRYFCGVQATGRGHFSRYLVVREILERAGHEVFGYSTGRELPSYAAGVQRFQPGPSFFIRGNRVDFAASLKYNVRNLRGYYRSIADLAEFLREELYDEAIVDFEPVSARALARAGMKFTIFDNQTLALLKFPYKGPAKMAARGMRTFVRFYYGSLRGAKRILTYSFAPLQAQLPHQEIIPPCVRREVLDIQPTAGDHLLFYSSIGELPPGLIEFARANPSVEIRAYVLAKPPAGVPDNIVLPTLNSAGFLPDFASCRGFIANAGFESLAEAIHLRKPVTVVPIRGQWEQQLNGFLVEHFGIGQSAMNFSRETFERAARHEAPPSEQVRDWVSRGREILEAALTR